MDGELQHKICVEMARELVEIIAGCLREEEHRDAFEEFYRVCHEGIAAYVAALQSHLKPERAGKDKS